MKRIDIEEAARLHTFLSLCRSKGVDPVRVLDEKRLLRHKGTVSEDIASYIRTTIDIIQSVPDVTEMASVKTPMDMKNLIIRRLEAIYDELVAEK